MTTTKATEQELRIELSIWQDRLADAKRLGLDWTAVRHCTRKVSQLRREITAARF